MQYWSLQESFEDAEKIYHDASGNKVQKGLDGAEFAGVSRGCLETVCGRFNLRDPRDVMGYKSGEIISIGFRNLGMQ